jgi:hypothetical protein
MNRIIILLCLLLCRLTSVAQNATLQIDKQVITSKEVRFEISDDGLPKRFYLVGSDSEVKAQQVLFEPMHFHFYTSAKTQEKMNSTGFDVAVQNADSIVWHANSASTSLKMSVQGKMLTNGVVSYHIYITAIKDVSLTNVNFHIPFEKQASKYLTGLGEKGGLRPDTLRWQYNNWRKVKPIVWIGNDLLGMYFNIQRSTTLLSNTNGAMQINVKGGSMLLDVHADQIVLKENEQLNFDFNLVVTPQISTELQVPVTKKLKFYNKLVQER